MVRDRVKVAHVRIKVVVLGTKFNVFSTTDFPAGVPDRKRHDEGADSGASLM